MVNGAQIILADEPTGALDSASGHALMDILHQLHLDGHTVVIVTHDKNIAQQTQRIIEISDGKIVSDKQNQAQTDTKQRNQLPSVEDNGRHRCGAILLSLFVWHGGPYSVIACVHFCRCWELSSVFLLWCHQWPWGRARRSIMDEIGKLGSTTLEIRPGTGWGLSGLIWSVHYR